MFFNTRRKENVFTQWTELWRAYFRVKRIKKKIVLYHCSISKNKRKENCSKI